MNEPSGMKSQYLYLFAFYIYNHFKGVETSALSFNDCSTEANEMFVCNEYQ